MAGERTFVVKFLADTNRATSGFNKINAGLKGLNKATGGLIPGFGNIGIAATAAFGAVAAGLTTAARAAIDDQKSQVELQRQLEATFGANEALTTSAEKYISVTQLRTGTSDTELRSSLGSLVRATGDLTQSQDLLNTAQDISAATGRDLGSVSLALAKASQGQFTALSRLGIPLDEQTKKSKDFGAVLDTLNTQFGGAADAAANTFGGALKRTRTVIGEAVETIGFAILNNELFKDSISKLPNALQAAIDAFGERGLKAALSAFVDNLGIVGAYAKLIGLSVSASFADMANKATQSLALIGLAANIALGVVNTLAGTELKLADPGQTQKAADDARIAFELQQGVIRNLKTDLNLAANAQKSMSAETNRMTQIAKSFGIEIKGAGTSVGDLDGKLGGTSKTVKTAADKLKLYTDALKSSSSAQKSLTKAQTDSQKAQESLTSANTNLTDAQNAFNAAVAGYGADSPQARKASKDLELAQRGLERAGYRVEQSVFAVRDAEKNLADVRKDPESTPQAIREAEIALAEAKLSSADAVDEQTKATVDLTQSQDLLNEAVSGATIGSALYTQVSDALADAKKRQEDATAAVADAIDRETDALERYNEALAKAGELAKLYPKIAAGVPNPMASTASSIPSTVTGNAGFTFADNPGQMNIVINAGLGASGVQVGQELNDYLSDYLRLNGGSIGNFVGVR